MEDIKITIPNGTSKRLPTKGKLCDKNIVVTAEGVNDRFDAGYNAGFDSGMGAGYQQGYDQGESDGYAGGYMKGVAEGEEKGLAEGYSKGMEHGTEAGEQAEYNRFWDIAQVNGTRRDYPKAFGSAFYDETFKPKYDMAPINANMMFAGCSVTDLQAALDRAGVTLDFSKVTLNRIVQFLMESRITRIGTVDLSSITNAIYVFYGANELETIEKLIFVETNVFATTWFEYTAKLKNINAVEGVISNSISFNWSPLTPASMKNIIACLKNYAGTDKANTYQVKFTDACWTALEADSTAPDGGTWKKYVDSLGWNT